MKQYLLFVFILSFALFLSGCDFGAVCGDGYCDSSEEFLNNCHQDCGGLPPIEFECHVDIECDDNNDYTNDFCMKGFCVHEILDCLSDEDCEENMFCEEGICFGYAEPFEPTIICNDTDGGIDYYTSGTVTRIEIYENGGGALTAVDVCDGALLLEEKYCNEELDIETDNYNCTESGMICELGACVNETVLTVLVFSNSSPVESIPINQTLIISNSSPINLTPIINDSLPPVVIICNDTDGGFDYAEIGVAYGTLDDETHAWIDYCTDAVNLIEYGCSGLNVTFETHGCEFACSNGACINQNLTCTWSDWRNQDQPSGTGDYEPVTDICASSNIENLECQTLTGADWSETGERYECIPNYGGRCVKSLQSDNACQDYKVRVCCKE